MRNFFGLLFLFLSIMQRHRQTLVHCTALFFLVAGLAYCFHLGDNLHYPDEKQYVSIAVNVAAGNGYSIDGIKPTAIFPPFWPLILAFFIKLGTPIWLLRYLNFIALSLCVYVIQSILKHEQAEEDAFLPALLLITYCVLFYTAGTLYPQTIFSLVLLLIIRLVIIRTFSYLHCLIFGLLCALIIMIHPTGVFIPPLTALWLLFQTDNRHILSKVSISALIAFSLVSVWSIRNYTAFCRFIPLTSHGGDTLYIGNNPNTSLTEWYNYIYEDYYLKAGKLPEEEQNKYYLRKTIQFWKEQPAAAVKLYLLKLADYFNFRNHLYLENEFDLLRSIIMFFTYYPLLLCLLLRLFFFRRIPLSKTERLLVSIYIISAFFHAVFLPRIRFRLPYDIVLITEIGIMYSQVRSIFPAVSENRMQTF